MALLLYQTDHTARLVGLKDQDGNAVEGATVTATLLDKNYQPAEADPFPLTFTDAGQGDYTAAIGDDNTLALGIMYHVRYVAERDGIRRTWFDQLSVARGTF